MYLHIVPFYGLLSCVAACLVFDDIQPYTSQSRTKELKLRKEQYWYVIYIHNGLIIAQITCLLQ